MPQLEKTITDRESAEESNFAQSGIVDEHGLATEMRDREKLAAHWDDIIDHKLIDWGNTGREFEDEELVGPSNKAITTSYGLVRYMQKQGWALPTGVIPDGEGGIVFENRRDPWYQRIEIDKDGSANLVDFYDCKLVDRVSVNID